MRELKSGKNETLLIVFSAEIIMIMIKTRFKRGWGIETLLSHLRSEIVHEIGLFNYGKNRL